MNGPFSTVSDAEGKIPGKTKTIQVEEVVMMEVFQTSVFVFMTLTLAAGSYIAVFLA